MKDRQHTFHLLLEDKATDTLKKYIRNTCADYLKPYLDTNINQLPQELSDSLYSLDDVLFKQCSDKDTNLMMFLRIHFLKNFDIRHGKGPIKFIIGLARIGLGELGFYSYNSNQSDLALLKQLVLFADGNEQVKLSLDENLNGMSFQELKSALNEKRKEFNRQMRTQLGDARATNGKYKVIPINSAKDAEKYGQYTEWCVTHGSYDSYAKNGSRFYFCLRKGFENVPRQVGNGCPLDDYGLSMVSVLVDMDGEPTIVTTRWNHDNDGENNERLRTAKQVQEVLGIPFYQIFKPYTREELHAMGVILLDEVQDLLDSGTNPKKIFDWVGNFNEGIARVTLNKKWNLINKEYKLISNQWFDWVRDFYNGFAPVELNGKWNSINQDGKYISSQWFDSVDDFSDGFARVHLSGKWNFINRDGKYISSQWFDRVGDFSDGFASVILNNKSNFINQKGKCISNQWFDYANGFYNGFASVRLNDKWNYINQEGRCISNQWFDDVDGFSDGFAVVRLNNKYNFINREGNLISNQWFDNASGFYNGFSVVELNNKRNLINQEGKLISNQWFDSIGQYFTNGFTRVNLNGKENYINQEGNLISNQWFDNVCDFHNGFVQVKLNGKWHKINTRGEIVESKNTDKKTIAITEEQKHKLDLLLEDKEGKNLARARHYLQRLGYSQEASQNVIQTLRNEIPACRLGNYKFMLGIVRLYVEKELDNDSNKGKLFNILNSITSGPAIDAYDYNFNGKNINNLVADIEKISFEQPYGARQASVEKPKTIRANNGYTIVPIFSYEEAEQYAKFTDWCVVNNDAAYDAHTIYGGMFYFCLKDGFEEINVWDGNFDREHTPPYDVYGLSMIAVCIGPDGEERSITTRWNHRCLHGTIPVEKLEGIIGMHFSEAFKPWVKIHTINTKGEIVESKNMDRKTIVITEETLKMLKESVLMDTLPDDIRAAVVNKKTSLGNNPAFPDVFDEGFIEKVVSKSFKSAKETLVSIGSIDGVKETEPVSILNRLIKNAQERERKIRTQLEKLAYNYAINLFNVPEDSVELIISLCDSVDTSRPSIILDPVDGDDDFEFADIVDAESVRGEVYKRRLLDALIMGGSMRLSSNIKSYISEIYELDPVLPDLYRKILALNTYLLFTKEDLNMTEEDMKQLGTVEVTIGNDIKKNRIESQGVIFPILLSETIRGFMELFISHGLPDDIDRAKTIIGKSDFLKNEPWDMRIGPALWDMFSDTFEDIDSTTIPYVLFIVGRLSVGKFNYLFKNIFAKTRLGKSVMGKIINKAKENQNEQENNTGTMKPENNRKSILSDEIDPEEL